MIETKWIILILFGIGVWLLTVITHKISKSFGKKKVLKMNKDKWGASFFVIDIVISLLVLLWLNSEGFFI